MAAILYLPRLFVYHCGAENGSLQSETFKVMERRLMAAIMTPAMIVSWGAGLVLVFVYQMVDWTTVWSWTKTLAVLLLTAIHFYLVAQVRVFAEDRNARPAVYFRVLNEMPTLLMIVIVIMVVVKPL
ncbi:MAG: CopD family protein [Alphaproteobacteria bacterium]|nr:CopD family protein [Alphaproteobacteria bacterium]